MTQDLVSLLEAEWASIDELLSGLDDGSWSTPVLPGWDVHDVVAHLIGTEKMLAGSELPSVQADGEHVRNDIGKANELWVVSLRDLAPAELLAEFRSITGQRLGALRAMSQADFDAPSWTPAGQGTYGRWMQIRVFDCWMHEQDVRSALRLPGNETGPVAECSLDEVAGALGYIIGKRGRAPQGSSVLISLTGPVERELRVVTDGRAKVVESIEGEPTATIAMSSSLFVRLAGGREDPQAALRRVSLGGDTALAGQLATSLAFTI